MVTVLHYDRPTARKEHVCDSCRRIIGKCEEYDRQDNVFDGQRYAFKSCAQCRQAASWVYRTTDAGDWYDEGLDLREYLSDLYLENGTLFRLWHYMSRRWRRLDGSLVDLKPILGEVAP